jgi:predicted dehydrogenase
MTRVVRIGLVGCGRAAERLHVPAIGPSTGTSLNGVYDPLPARRELIASMHDRCSVFETIEALVQSDEVDAIIVATPPESHASVAALALRKGRPVLIEKPLASSVKEGAELQRLQADSAALAMVGMNRRAWEPAVKLRTEIARRRAGRVQVRMAITSDIAGWSPLVSAADPLDDLSTHQLDLLRFLLGCDIAKTEAAEIQPGEYQLSVEMEDGTTATCTAAYRSPSMESIEVSVGPSTYLIRVGSDRLWPATGPARRTLDLVEMALRKLRRRPGGLARSYAHQLRTFARLVRGETVAYPGIDDGLAVMRAIEAARGSLARGGTNASPLTIGQR